MSQCTIRVAFANRTELQAWQNATAVASRINSAASVDVSAKFTPFIRNQPALSTAAPQAEALTHSHRMKRVAGRIMAINRFMPQSGKAATTSPGSFSVDENDLSLDLGHYVGRANHAAQVSPSPSTAAAAEFSTIGCSEDVELSVMADPVVAVPSSSKSALNAAAADLDDGVPSRNSVSSTLAPRLQQYPDDISEADVRCPSTYFQT
jgi:hypothetical protein